jgi:hypothetical protein
VKKNRKARLIIDHSQLRRMWNSDYFDTEFLFQKVSRSLTETGTPSSNGQSASPATSNRAQAR